MRKHLLGHSDVRDRSLTGLTLLLSQRHRSRLALLSHSLFYLRLICTSLELCCHWHFRSPIELLLSPALIHRVLSYHVDLITREMAVLLGVRGSLCEGLSLVLTLNYSLW
jgi:hypothetical protein